jgi:ABC-2 type transport system ATP-binding protein
MPEGVSAEARPDGTMHFTYRTSLTPAESVLAAVRAAGISIADVRTEEADLEDVFLSLTRA